MIERLLPPCVAVVEADAPWMWEQGLLPEEAASLGARAVEKRRREFTAGRNCARGALAALDLPVVPLLPGGNREPLWPEGVVGSITHCARYCAAVAARREEIASLGIDAELHEALVPGVEAMVCTEAERRWIESAPMGDEVHWATVIFSAKESIYKAWYPLMHRWLDFHDAELDIDPERGCYAARLSVECAASFKGRFLVAGDYVLTSVVVPPDRGQARGRPP